MRQRQPVSTQEQGSRTHCPDGEIGRRSGLKIRRPQGRGGSSPPLGTKRVSKLIITVAWPTLWKRWCETESHPAGCAQQRGRKNQSAGPSSLGANTAVRQRRFILSDGRNYKDQTREDGWLYRAVLLDLETNLIGRLRADNIHFGILPGLDFDAAIGHVVNHDDGASSNAELFFNALSSASGASGRGAPK